MAMEPNDFRERLVRLEERGKLLSEQQEKQHVEVKTGVAAAVTQISALRDRMEEQFNRLGQEYVTKTEFQPVRNVVFAICSVVGASVITALMALLLRTRQ